MSWGYSMTLLPLLLQKSLTCAPVGVCVCVGWGVLGEQLASWSSSPSCTVPLSISRPVSRANGQNAHRLTGVRDTALERKACYSAVLLITPHRSLLALQWIWEAVCTSLVNTFERKSDYCRITDRYNVPFERNIKSRLGHFLIHGAPKILWSCY